MKSTERHDNFQQLRHTRAEWITRFQECGCACYYCGVALTFSTAEKDHKTPLCRSGSDSIENIVPACKPCNQRKAWRTEDEFRPLLAILSKKSELHAAIPNPTPYKLSPEEKNEPGLLKKIVTERERISWAWRNPA